MKMRSLIVDHPAPAVLALGVPASLTCTVRLDPSLAGEAELYWLKDGRGTVRERTSMASVGESLFSVKYSLERVSQEDAGRYSCHVITSYDSVESRAGAVRVRPASWIVRQPTSQTVMEGGEATFGSVTGHTAELGMLTISVVNLLLTHQMR